MTPNVIKFVSADKLTGYQLWSSYGSNRLPEHVIERMVSAPLAPQHEDVDCAFRVLRRRYELFDRYIDETNGNYVWEYREVI